MSVILGINAFHADSAACLVIDGKLTGAVAEERLGSRIKHDSAFPVRAINYLLSNSGIRLRDVTHVAIARDTHANRFAKIKYVVSHPLRSSSAVLEHLKRIKTTDNLLGNLAAVCDEDPNLATYKIIEVEHHLAHIASAYYPSPFESLTAGFSYDGSGDFVSMMAAKCNGSKIEILDRVMLPNSLGFFYTALCQFIGFEQFGEEYKVMGLAPYGDDRYRLQMQELITADRIGWFKLNKRYFSMHDGGKSGQLDSHGQILVDKFYSSKMQSLLGKPRIKGAPITQREMDIAKSTQIRFEEISIACLNRLHEIVESDQLAMAGGCALNGVTNARILRETPFKKQYLQSASSDDGTCIGAAFYVWHHVLGNAERFSMKHSFWGPEYPDSELLSVARFSPYQLTICSSEKQLSEEASQLISAGLVVGWYQGRSEWGPRSLGNRSILAHPGIPTMKDTINIKIKRRESFRPFAPSVLKEDMNIFFEQNVDSPFMMHVVKIREEWRSKLPAVTHVDGTGRVQTVDKESNPLFHKLISAFKDKTGIGMVLNTSFNENEPVVDTPQQAYDCFRRTDMDALCLGRYILRKG